MTHAARHSMTTGASSWAMHPRPSNPNSMTVTGTPLRLPHDWAIDGPFDSALNPHTGALPISGTGGYRKTFKLAPDALRRYYSSSLTAQCRTLGMAQRS